MKSLIWILLITLTAGTAVAGGKHPVKKVRPYQPASFIGNLSEWTALNLKYPEAAREEGVQGQVAVRFLINANGEVTTPEVIRSSSHKVLDRAALQLVKRMPKWKPATYKGKPVKIYSVLPVIFKLQS